MSKVTYTYSSIKQLCSVHDPRPGKEVAYRFSGRTFYEPDNRYPVYVDTRREMLDSLEMTDDLEML